MALERLTRDFNSVGALCEHVNPLLELLGLSKPPPHVVDFSLVWVASFACCC